MLIRNNKVLTVHSKWLYAVDPYNPLDLPPYTIRVKYKQGREPEIQGHTYTKTLVDRNENIWDITITDESTDWSGLFYYPYEYQYDYLLEVLGANSAGITDMRNMFRSCQSLTSVAVFNTSSVTDMTTMFARCSSLMSVPLFDTSNVTNMTSTFAGCYSLTTIPLLDTSKVTDMTNMCFSCSSLTSVPLLDTSLVTSMSMMFMKCYRLTSIPLFNTSNVTFMNLTFSECYRVESGALALYQQASTQTTPPQQHLATFESCGIYTQSGAAELAQIPSDWK